MKIYLIRHGESQWNLENRLQGSEDSLLTDKGKEDSHKLGDYLNNLGIEIDRIYSSNSLRTISTAEIIRKDKKIEIKSSQALKEMNVGTWQGMTWSEIRDKFPVEYTHYWESPDLYQANNGGEDFYAVKRRAVSFLNQFVKMDTDQTILIVSHGVTLNSIFNYCQKQTIKDFWFQPLIESTALSLIEINEEKQLNLKFIGKLDHLK